ncbi:DUF2663 family protein [Salipaludibacillus keqinensis]|uniref:DUF2663 family protein n=1 Tax=Salipaludibacillus keqinensis TaxID=2045207 RepID=UPI001304E66C|nr:DUF2663 family protein [Salipaludibacillus keqinensis]
MEGKEKASAESVESYLIHAIIKAKTKEVKAEKRLFRAGLYMLGIIAIFSLYLSFNWKVLTESSSFLAGIATDPIVLLFMLLTGLVYVHLHNMKFKYEKAESDYDKLKEDMIERASEIWSDSNRWKDRPEILRDLKEKYNINLYHK